MKQQISTTEIQTRALIVFSGRTDYPLMFDSIPSMEENLNKHRSMPNYMHHKLQYREGRYGNWREIDEVDMCKLLKFKNGGAL